MCLEVFSSTTVAYPSAPRRNYYGCFSPLWASSVTSGAGHFHPSFPANQPTDEGQEFNLSYWSKTCFIAVRFNAFIYRFQANVNRRNTSDGETLRGTLGWNCLGWQIGLWDGEKRNIFVNTASNRIFHFIFFTLRWWKFSIAIARKS